MPTFHLDMFLLGCAGGLLPDVLRLIKNRYEKLETIYLQPSFWLGLILLIGLGGLCAWLGGATDFKAALAFGYGAPEAISKLLSASGSTATPPSPVAHGLVSHVPAKFKLLQWWQG